MKSIETLDVDTLLEKIFLIKAGSWSFLSGLLILTTLLLMTQFLVDTSLENKPSPSDLFAKGGPDKILGGKVLGEKFYKGRRLIVFVALGKAKE